MHICYHYKFLKKKISIVGARPEKSSVFGLFHKCQNWKFFQKKINGSICAYTVFYLPILRRIEEGPCGNEKSSVVLRGLMMGPRVCRSVNLGQKLVLDSGSSFLVNKKIYEKFYWKVLLIVARVQKVDVFIKFHLANIGLATILMVSALVFNKVMSVCVWEREIKIWFLIY